MNCRKGMSWEGQHYENLSINPFFAVQIAVKLNEIDDSDTKINILNSDSPIPKWSDFRDAFKEIGSILPVIKSDEENDFIFRLIKVHSWPKLCMQAAISWFCGLGPFRRRSTHVPNLTDELSAAKEPCLNQFGTEVSVWYGKSVKFDRVCRESVERLSNLT